MRNTRLNHWLSHLLIASTALITTSAFAKDDPCIAFIALAGGTYNQQSGSSTPVNGFPGFQVPGNTGTELEDPAKACKSDYLCRISLYTYCTLIGVSDLVVNILKSDKSDFTANNSTYFSTIGAGYAQNTKKQIDPGFQRQLLNDFFNDPSIKSNIVTETSLPINASTKGSKAVANELSFQTLLGSPYFSTKESYKDPKNPISDTPVDSALNYIENASGLSITHVPPKLSWKGSDDDKNRYIKYYKTISAVQTYNGYVLSGLYANYKNNEKNPTNLTTTQLSLIQNASSSDWLTKVATQSIGEVLRQLLLFNSQSYVLLAQLVKTQQDQLATQAMTNTLLVLANQATELSLYNFANPAGGSI